jgi:hypothetical protein
MGGPGLGSFGKGTGGRHRRRATGAERWHSPAATVRPVVVTFGPWRLDEYRRAVLDVGRRLDQEAMYVRLDEPRVELIAVTPDRFEAEIPRTNPEPGRAVP